MTNDLFEEQVRAQLHGATDAETNAFLDVDPAEVLQTGQHVLRRRRLAAVGGAVATVLVAGLATWSALGAGTDRASVPAGQGRTTASGTSGVTAVLDAFSDLAGPDGRALAIPGPQRVAVTVDPTRAPDLVYSEVDAAGGLVPLGGSSLDGVTPLGATWGTAGVGPHVLVGVLPARAVQLQLVTPPTDEGGHAATTVTAPLPGTERQAFAVRFAEASDVQGVRHLLWWDEDGSVRDENGALVPSVALGDPAGTVVFVSEPLGRFGTFSRGDGDSLLQLEGSRNTSRRPVLASGRGNGDRIDGLFAAVVPASATPGRLTPTAGTEVAHPLSRAPLPGTDLAVLWARYSYPEATAGSGYSSVTWTEGGRTVTERP
jgi:hypothetical protein